MTYVRISLALAFGFICWGASAQEVETPFGGGPIVHAGPHVDFGTTGEAVALSSFAKGDESADIAAPSDPSPHTRGRSVAGERNRGRSEAGERNGGQTGKGLSDRGDRGSAGRDSGGGRSGRN